MDDDQGTFVPSNPLSASSSRIANGPSSFESAVGEFAYDYVEVRRDYLAWAPTTSNPQDTSEDYVNNDRSNDQWTKAEEGQSGSSESRQDGDGFPPMHERHGIEGHSQMLENGWGGNGGGKEGEGSTELGVIGDRHAVKMEDEKKRGKHD